MPCPGNQPLQLVERRAGVYGVGGLRDARGEVGGAVRGHERGGGVDQHDIAPGSADPAGQDAARDGGILGGIAAGLTLAWSPATDGSGVSGYDLRWTSQVTDTLVADTEASFLPSNALTSSFSPDEGQKAVAHLTSLDVYDQGRTQTFVAYADGPFTPDYVWLDDLSAATPFGNSACTLLGVDRRAARQAAGNAARGTEQALRASWNAEALRLSWTGANWDSDGDLFIYLDMLPGSGSTAVFDPYPATAGRSAITLPNGSAAAPMAADRLAWVRSTSEALLLTWDGSAWGEGVVLNASQYRFGAVSVGGVSHLVTDLYLPFTLLGMAEPATSPLDLVALASEEDALRLWAALPNTNPVNSARSSRSSTRTALLEREDTSTDNHFFAVGALTPVSFAISS